MMNTTSQLASPDNQHQESTILCVRCTNSVAASTRLVAQTKLTTGWLAPSHQHRCHQAAGAGTRCHLPPELRRKCSAALLNSNMWTLCEHCSLHVCMWAVAVLIYNNKITVHISVSHAKVRLIVRQGTCTNCVTCPSLQGAHLVFSSALY